jgi:hypothetical protein
MKKLVYECDICGQRFDDKRQLMRGFCLKAHNGKRPIDICYGCTNQIYRDRDEMEGDKDIIIEAINKIEEQKHNLPEDTGTAKYGVDLALNILQETIDKKTVQWRPFKPSRMADFYSSYLEGEDDDSKED